MKKISLLDYAILPLAVLGYIALVELAAWQMRRQSFCRQPSPSMQSRQTRA